MSCQLRSYRLRSTTGARSPSSRLPAWPAATPTIGSPPQGYTCGLATRSARDAGDLAARVSRGEPRDDQARKGGPILGVASDRCVTAARSPRARATAATVTAGSSSTPHRGTTSAPFAAGHNTGRRG